MKQNKTILLILIFIATAVSTAVAGDNERADTLRPRYGAYMNIGYNIHSTNFDALPTVPSCAPTYDGGGGLNYSLGLLYEYPIYDTYTVGLRMGYMSLGGELIADERSFIASNGKVLDAVIEHKISPDLSIVSIEPTFSWRALDNMFLHIGPQFGIFSGSSFEQSEEIVKPDNSGVFADTKKRVRNEFSGDIENMSSMYFAVNLGVSLEIPFNGRKDLLLAPEIFYSAGLTDVVNDLDWGISSVRGGLSIKYTPFQMIYVYEYSLEADTVEVESEFFKVDTLIAGYSRIKKYERETKDTTYVVEEVTRTDTLFYAAEVPEEEPIEIEPEIPQADTLVPEYTEEIPNNLVADLEVRGIINNDEEVPLGSILVKVEMKSEVYPLLAAVFFDKNESAIPYRYTVSPPEEDFGTEELFANPLIYHRNLLPIIAGRMREKPNSKIDIFAYVDSDGEKNNVTLATERAGIIYSYFTNVCGISPKRVLTHVNNSNPVAPDNRKAYSEKGYAEGRRVEIRSNDLDVMRAVNVSRRQRLRYIVPREIILDPTLSSNKDIDFWKITGNQNGYSYINSGGAGAAKITKYNLSENSFTGLSSGKPLNFKLSITDFNENTASDEKEIRVYVDTSDIEVESLTLALFGISNSGLEAGAKKQIREFVADLKPGDMLYIRGFSDDLGEPYKNKRLSEQRAQKVGNYIRTVNKNARIMEISGMANQRFPQGISSYNSPEERFMSRTAEIEIRRKWK